MSAEATPPRSLHVIGGRGLGGAERFFVRLVNALARRGHAVAAVTVGDGEIARAIDPAVRQFHAPMFASWDLYSRHLISQAARTFRADVVQTYMGRATRIARFPAAATPVHLARLGGYYNLKGYRHAHAWVGNTAGILAYLRSNGLAPARTFTIGNFVDTPGPLPADSLSALRHRLDLDGCRIVLGLGRLHPNKGWSSLLQAFARLPHDEPARPLHLVMVGDGPLRASLQEEAARLGIAGRVHWTGWQSDPAAFYQLAEVFVCASVHEPLGNVILEAWANRALVVSTRAEGPLELMTDGVNGLLAPVSDPEGLAATIARALALDSGVRDAMTAAGAREIEHHYSESAIVAAYVALYETLCGQATGSGIGR